MVPPAAIKRARKASQRAWREVCNQTVSMPAKSIVAPYTDQQVATLQRLAMVITRLTLPEPTELHRVLSHADIVVGASGVRNLLGDSQFVDDLCFAGGELISDEECNGETIAGWYATTMQHLDWIRDTSPGIEERHVADNMRVRFFMSVGHVAKFAAWLRVVENFAGESKDNLWINVANAGVMLGRALTDAAKEESGVRESPIYAP